MDEKELSDTVKMLANHSHALSTPINIDQLISDGVLKLIGKTYYVESLDALPKEARLKLKSCSKGKHGLKVTFHKETRAMCKLSEEYKAFRD